MLKKLRRGLFSQCAGFCWIALASTMLAAPPEPGKVGEKGEQPKATGNPQSSQGPTINPEQRSREIKASVERWQERVQKRLGAVDELAQTLDLKKITSQKIVSSELIGLLDDLDEEAVAIVEASETIGPDLDMFRKALLQASPSFEKMAVELERASASKKNVEIQQLYFDFITHARKLASHYANQAKGIDGIERTLGEQIAFVKESREFIADVKGLLEAIPSDGGVELEKLVERINQYIDAFRKTIDTMHGITEKIAHPSNPKSSSERSSPSKGSAKSAPNPESSKALSDALTRFAKIGK